MREEQLADLVAGLPGADSRSVKGAEGKTAMEAALVKIVEAGRDRVAALADLLAPGKGDDSKARYALGALAVLVCQGPPLSCGRSRCAAVRKWPLHWASC